MKQIKVKEQPKGRNHMEHNNEEKSDSSSVSASIPDLESRISRQKLSFTLSLTVCSLIDNSSFCSTPIPSETNEFSVSLQLP
jgi:hypothetical protein